MNEWWIVCFFIVIALAESLIIIYPLRRSPVLSCLVILAVFTISAFGYYYWGGFVQWREFVKKNKAREVAQQMLHSIKSPQELIKKLKVKLAETPNSAKGWYLLGRLYSGQNEGINATKAFARAYQLKPEAEQYAVNYAHSLWQMNHQQFNSEIRALLNKLLKNDPNQPDALAMLAMDAFVSHDYENAIQYWQRLLNSVPRQSEEARAIHKAIAKAQKQINSRSNTDD